MRTSSISVSEWALLERLLMPANALVIELMLQTGLRVSDVLNIRTRDIVKDPRLTVSESKTGKRKRVYIGVRLYKKLLAQAGKIWLFPSPRDEKKHRTRQAVWADVKRASKAMRIPSNVGTHSARKSYAVGEYVRTKNLDKVRTKLNHDRLETTIIYLLEIFNKGG